MVIAIVIAEISFWLLIALGLTARYVAGRRRLGLGLLAATPLVDVILLAVVAVDLAGGGTASTSHALSAVYLGVSLVFGHAMIDWADVRVAHRFAGGPPPTPKPTDPAEKARLERSKWIAHAKAWAIGAGLMMLAVLVVGDSDRTAAFSSLAAAWTVVLLIDAAFSLPAPRATKGKAAS